MAETGGLSDVLRQMAEGPSQPKSAPEDRRAAQPPQPVPDDPDDAVIDDDEVLVAEVDEPDAEVAAAPVAPRGSSSQSAAPPVAPTAARRRAPAPPPTSHTLKEVGACLFTTFSVLMLLWAVWGSLLLFTEIDVPRRDQPDAQTMAKVSQVFYLLALVGLSYAGFLFHQVSQAKKKEKQAAARRLPKRS